LFKYLDLVLDLDLVTAHFNQDQDKVYDHDFSLTMNTDNPNPTITLKKPHPCGSREFSLIQMGPEVVLRCCQCDSLVRIRREKFEKAVTKKNSGSRSQETGEM
jgi:hypothetical protein